LAALQVRVSADSAAVATTNTFMKHLDPKNDSFCQGRFVLGLLLRPKICSLSIAAFLLAAPFAGAQTNTLYENSDGAPKLRGAQPSDRFSHIGRDQ
jgi:hypothetical protein